MSHYDGEALKFFFKKFTDDDGDLSPDEGNYSIVKTAIHEKLGGKDEPPDVICRAINAKLD